jgi:magnesium transporter
MPAVNDVRVVRFDRKSGASEAGSVDLLDAGKDRESAWLWIDIAKPLNAETIALLKDRFDIPLLAIQDASRARHPPKLELLDRHTFLLLREISRGTDSSEPRFGAISMFVNNEVFISIHADVSPAIDSVANALPQPGDLATRTPDNLAYLICRRLADNCEPVVLAQEELLAKIEDRIFDEDDDSAVEELAGLNRVLRRLRRVLAYQSAVFDQLRHKVKETVVPFDRHEAVDLFENTDRLATLCQLNQELAIDLLNAHRSVVSHRLNSVMQVLTITTILFLPLTLLAGIYGMNFEFMPELTWKYGYFGVLGLMAVIAGGLTLYFKRKHWLG